MSETWFAFQSWFKPVWWHEDGSSRTRDNSHFRCLSSADVPYEKKKKKKTMQKRKNIIFAPPNTSSALFWISYKQI